MIAQLNTLVAFENIGSAKYNEETMDIYEVSNDFGPLRIFADQNGEYFLPCHWIKEEGKLPRKKKGCTHFVKAGPNEKEIRTFYYNPDFLKTDD